MATFTTSPTVPVLQSDTFEIQRQKINNMATDLVSAISATATGPGLLAYVQFATATSGAVTILSQYNVSSVTRNDVGIYTINFSTALSNNTYVVIGCGTQNIPNNGNVTVYEYWSNSYPTQTAADLKTTSGVKIMTLDSDIGGRSRYDGIVSLMVIGNR